MKLDPRFKDTEYVVEANGYERQAIWEQWSTEAMFKRPHCNNIRWEQDSMGFMLQVGTIDSRPVTIEFYWAKLNGHLILFYNACSQVVDHKMVDEWIEKYCNPHHEGRRSHSDASNFTHVIHYIKDCEAEALVKEAEAHAEAGNPDDAAQLLERCWRDYPYSQDKKCQKVNALIKGMKKHPGAKLEKRK